MLSFESVSSQHLTMLMNWLDSPHVQEFWDNSLEHREDINIFANGRKVESTYFEGIFSYWIGKYEDIPFCLLMTSPISEGDDIPSIWMEFLSKTEKNFSIDFCIGNMSFLGKGLAANALNNFITFFNSKIEPKARVFLIDPDEKNPRAKRVYMKAGFKQVGSFKMPSGYFSGQSTSLMVKVIEH
ncbi:hypothetical protein BI347_02780 [Chromobacterium sphagni]|uniref:N-acetyltransferase domain-containing protein n=1 Tax=Chromobacterium sphagni TaxID=1903179 RepID=A0A1S1WZ13_9NEIS|nr:GNAT family N-acetyltransferase [Chromobacterium sphagni]OHX12547.1 hypothetical protein BI347_02780 [Chromobacterium sphagni]